MVFFKNNFRENKNNKYKFENKALKYTATENKEMHKFETFFFLLFVCEWSQPKKRN
jgi:hypothetical protein